MKALEEEMDPLNSDDNGLVEVFSLDMRPWGGWCYIFLCVCTEEILF